MCFLFLKVKPFGRIKFISRKYEKKPWLSLLYVCSPALLKDVYAFTRKLFLGNNFKAKYLLKFQF